ncbi:MAG: class I SAM-dependent methyltransferase [Ilumatobacteraceae bacterium]
MNDWGRYGTEIDLDDLEDSRATVLRAAARHPEAVDILELGSSTGRTTAVLQRWGRRVTAVEQDPAAAAIAERFADRVIVGDLDQPAALDTLTGSEFDLVIAADVLEHLRDPLRCLRQALGLLRPGGLAVLSIPNVAHGDVRLALLGGHFAYTDIGLLDRTHVQLFTRHSLEQLVAEAGLRVVHWDRVAKLIGHTEVAVDDGILDWGRMVLIADPDSITYQWVIECRRIDDPLADGLPTGTPATDGTQWWLPPTLGPLADRVHHVAHHIVRLQQPTGGARSPVSRAVRRIARLLGRSS